MPRIEDFRATVQQAEKLLAKLGVSPTHYTSGTLFARSAINGARIGKIREADGATIDQAVARSAEAAEIWAVVRIADRAALVRRIGEKLREVHEPLAQLITLETGVPITECRRKLGYGFSSCDQMVAMSGTISNASARIQRNDMWLVEVWRPLGVTACISAISRPVAHFMSHCLMNFLCGNSVIWKPSDSASLSALAIASLVFDVIRDMDIAPEGLLGVLFGGRDIGKTLSEDFRLRYLSAATSIGTGRALNVKLAQSFTRGSLSLSGNNAAIVSPSADLGVAVNAVAASATMLAGQHAMCTRRLFLHADIYEQFIAELKQVFQKLRIGDPRLETTVMGPLVDRDAFETMQRILQAFRTEGGVITGGNRIEMAELSGAYYVRPAIVELARQTESMLRETLVPILFTVPFDNFEDAIAMDNAAAASHGSSLFTRNMQEVNQYLGMRGTACVVGNINSCAIGYDPCLEPFGTQYSYSGSGAYTNAAWKMCMHRTLVAMKMSTQDDARDALSLFPPELLR